MGIDFHNEKNRDSYTTRKADESWVNLLKELVPIDKIQKAVDVGCGGGIYLKALSEMGVASVIGVDYSEVMLNSAKENCKEYPNITFQLGDAFNTGLESNSYDLVLIRAVIHHLSDLQKCFEEAYRVLKDNGIFIIQDRTPEDCLLKGSESHIRGYFFEKFPKLIDKEIKRRYDSQTVINSLDKAGFKEIQEMKLQEVRKAYENKEELLKDLSARTGRSILHELNDEELNQLIEYIDKAISTEKIVEKDRWTIWKAIK